MKKQTALWVIFFLAIAGILFSGYLSYSEIYKKICALGTCTQVGAIPACVYGFIMYLIVFIISILGLRARE